MTLPADLARPLGRQLGRYQLALAVRGGLVVVLAAGVVAALAWKLERFGMEAAWRQGVLLSGLLGIGLVAGRWWRRRRLALPAASSRLDRSLHLQERLTTVEEFSSADPAPALYPLLVQDTAQALRATRGPAAPKPVTRTAMALAVVLLLLLLWPRALPHLRLAGAPHSPSGSSQQPPPTPPPPQSSPQSQPQDQPQNQQGGDRQDQQSQASKDGSQGGSRDESSGGEGRGQDRGDHTSPQGAGEDAEGDGRDGRQDQSGGTEGQERGRGGARTEAEQAGDQGRGGDEPSTHTQRASQGRDGEAPRSPEEALERARELAKAQDTQRPSGQAGDAGTGQGQEALKAEIQELLQELSGELEELQDRLIESDATGPLPGQDTDPNLYGDPELPDEAATRPTPIQLRTDVGETSGERRGGGVGEASGDVDTALPELQPEIAQLPATTEDVAPVDRHTVPPPYRSIFDRLFHRPTTQESAGP